MVFMSKAEAFCSMTYSLTPETLTPSSVCAIEKNVEKKMWSSTLRSSFFAVVCVLLQQPSRIKRGIYYLRSIFQISLYLWTWTPWISQNWVFLKWTLVILDRNGRNLESPLSSNTGFQVFSVGIPHPISELYSFPDHSFFLPLASSSCPFMKGRGNQ